MSLPESLSGWLNLLLGVFGFAFLAATYFLKKTVSWAFVSKLPFLALLTISLIAFGVVMGYGFPYSWHQAAEPSFHVLNLIFLGYVIYSLNRALRKEMELSSVVLGFTFLAIEQYSLLLWSFDPRFTWAFVFAQFVGIAGLVVLVVFVMKGFRR